MRLRGMRTGRLTPAMALVLGLAATIGLGGCAGLSGGGSAGTSGPPSAVPAGTASAGATASGPCGGAAHDLAGALRLVTDPAGCAGSVNTMWRGNAGVGAKWTQPRFVGYHDGQVPDDACGRSDARAADFEENAAYCPADDTVAYSIELLTALYRAGGAYQPVLILDHELGHRANRLGNTVGAVSRAEENQADCEAGAALRFANKAGRLPMTDAFGGAFLFFQLGDQGQGWFNTENPAEPGVHGTPRQRATAFLDGWVRGINRCHEIGRSPTGSITI